MPGRFHQDCLAAFGFCEHYWVKAVSKLRYRSKQEEQTLPF